MTITQAAEKLGVSRQRIHVLITKPPMRLKSRKIGFQHVIKLKDIETLAESIGTGNKGGRPKKQLDNSNSESVNSEP